MFQKMQRREASQAPHPSDEAEYGEGEEQQLHVWTSRFHRVQGGGVEDASTVVVLPEAPGEDNSNSYNVAMSQRRT